MKYWELTSESKLHFGVKLFRVELIVDCRWGKKGDKGGWIEKESNLYGNAWVSGDAMVYGNAEVYGNARVSGDARVYGNAEVSGNAEVYGNARVSGDARVYGNARVSKKVFVLNFGYNLTLTDNHIKYGCIQKTVEEWISWVNSDEVIETPRNTDKFKILEISLRLAIEQHKQLK